MEISCEKPYIEALKRVLDKTEYVFFMKSFRGINAFLDPWFDYKSMERCIFHSQSPHKDALRLLQLGKGAEQAKLEAELGSADIDCLVQAGIWRREEGRIETNNLVVVSYQGLLLLTEINPWYETCTNHNTDVYIGSDSLRLAENINFKRNATVLDLCSGTGIQGLLAARSAAKVVSVELNPKAVPVTRFNIRLNGLEDKIELREGDLYGVLRDDETFDCIYANPPFIPMTDDVAYPICGAGGEDGLMVLNRIFDELPKRLNPNGEAVFFCECLGDSSGVFFNKRVGELGRENGWRTMLLMNNRMEAELQISRMVRLTKLFNENFDEAAFKGRMEEIYRNLGATYLYSLIYRISASGDGDGVIRIIDQCNQWDMQDTAIVGDNVSIGDNPSSHGIYIDGKQIGAINDESVDIIASLKEDRTLRQTAERLWPKYSAKKKYALDGYPAFLEAVMVTAVKLKAVGAIRRRGE